MIAYNGQNKKQYKCNEYSIECMSNSCIQGYWSCLVSTTLYELVFQMNVE